MLTSPLHRFSIIYLFSRSDVFHCISTGIGIRSFIYIQAFLSIVFATIRQGLIKCGDEFEGGSAIMATSSMLILVTGLALVVSSFIQAILYGLTV